ncbi:MAG: 7-cyano-7-deazaguanine synthase [Bdellovibrionota bacterium]
MKQAVLLLSGGLDSAANLAANPEFEVKVALTLDYGQKSAIRELAASADLCRYFGIEHQTFELKNFASLVSNQSALLGGTEIPQPHSLDALEHIKKTAAAVWVPNRNGVFLSVAAALAESRGLDAVAVGFNAEEAVTFADNSVDYMKAMSNALRYSTRNQVEVVSATAHLTKTEIVKRLIPLDFPIHLIWSCYTGDKEQCGTCESCQRLNRALKHAG